jgi:hypothetical protein
LQAVDFEYLQEHFLFDVRKDFDWSVDIAAEGAGMLVEEPRLLHAAESCLVVDRMARGILLLSLGNRRICIKFNYGHNLNFESKLYLKATSIRYSCLI